MEDERDVQVVDWSLWREAEFNGEWLVYLKRIGRLSLRKHDSAEILKAGRFYVPTIKLFDLIFGNGWSFPLKLWVLGQEALVGIVDDLVVLRRQIAPTLRDFCRKGPGRLCRSVLHRGLASVRAAAGSALRDISWSMNSRYCAVTWSTGPSACSSPA